MFDYTKIGADVFKDTGIEMQWSRWIFQVKS